MSKLFDVYDVAKRYNRKVKTIHNRVSAGKFPPPDRNYDGMKFWTEDCLAEYDRKAAARARN